MARLYPHEQFIDGDVLRSAEFNIETGQYAGEINGHLDRDNLTSGLLEHTKFETDVFHKLLWVDGTALGDITRDTGDGLDQQWQAFLSGTFVVDDGAFEVKGQVSGELTAGTSLPFEVGVRVDGEIVARSGPVYLRVKNNAACAGTFPTGPGSKLVELVCRYGTGDNTFGSGPNTADFTHGALYARQARR